jgi:hypothetical protein
MSERAAQIIIVAVLSAIIGALALGGLVTLSSLHPPHIIAQGWFEHDGAVYRVVPAEVQ